MSLYQSSVNKPVTTILIFVAIAILGLFSLIKLPVNLIPDIDTNTIMVMTSYAGASAEDIENNVTKPLESILNGVSDLKHITSQSKENISIVTLEFNYGEDIDILTNDVRDKLDMLTTLPDECGNPIIFKFGADDIPIIMLSATANESMTGLYKILDDGVSSPLARIKGVGAVSIMGAPEREIQIYCDPYKLEAYNLSIEQIAQIVAQENRNLPAGNIDIGSNTYSMRVEQEFNDASEMLDIVVGHKDGAAVYLRDVATVDDRLQERSQESFTNKVQGAMIVIQKQSGANSVEIANKIHEKLPSLQKNLPSDVKLNVIVDTSENIVNTINALKETIIITFILVMFVVFVFLGRWRATFIIILSIPIALLGSFIYLFASGNTLNIISLSSLSIAIGMVVDDAIVVLENITTHIEKGSRPKQAAVFATSEVSISVIASTLTMLAVFLPLTLITGMAGVLFRQLGWIVSIIMIISTTAALSLVPMLCAYMLKLNPKQTKIHKILFTPIDKGLNSLSNGYGKAVDWAARHRGTTVLIAAVFFALTLVLTLPHLKTEYFPTQDNARLSVTIELPVGTRQDITRDLALELADRISSSVPEIRCLNIREGQADSENTIASMQSNGTHIISMNISLISVTKRKRGLIEIGEVVRDILREYSQIKKFNVIEGGQSGGVGGQNAVQVDIYGYSFEKTDAVAADLAARLRNVPSCTQVNISRDEYAPEYQVEFDREKLALNGLNVTTAAQYLRNRINGSIASYYREDGEEYDILVRYDKKYRESIEDIENITIYNSLGQGIKVRDLGIVKETLTPPTITRKDRERYLTVTGIVAKGYAMSDLVEDAEKELNQMDIPLGITWEFGGTYEDQKDSFRDLVILMALVLILVFIVMAAQFESLISPFVIMFSVPFGFSGVFIGLVSTGSPLGIMGMIGLLMLLGIVVKNGIVLIDYTILCRERGMGIIRSVTEAGRSRLRPVLMTTLTTVLGMFPLAFGTGEGAEMWRSMGLTMIFGLSLSTLVTLILVPVVYSIFSGVGVRKERKKEIKKIKRAALMAANN